MSCGSRKHLREERDEAIERAEAAEAKAAWHSNPAVQDCLNRICEEYRLAKMDTRETLKRAERLEALACKRENCALREPPAEALAQREPE